jgi:hypothetical protein
VLKLFLVVKLVVCLSIQDLSVEYSCLNRKIYILKHFIGIDTRGTSILFSDFLMKNRLTVPRHQHGSRRVE